MPRGVYVRTRKSLEERFWAKVLVTTDCWLWRPAKPGEYGRFMMEDGSLAYSHRVSYYLANGEWPPEDTRHRCHNPRCVRPAHLIAGTRAQNMQDMVDAGRSLAGERRPNSKLTWESVNSARSAHARGQSACSLAREHGVSERTMRQCLSGETWVETGER